MKGSFEIKRLLPNKPYYISAKDYDSRLGGEFRLFIHPFSIDDGNAFYYVRQLSTGQIQIEGEGYIVTDRDSLHRHKADARETFAGTVFGIFGWMKPAIPFTKKLCNTIHRKRWTMNTERKFANPKKVIWLEDIACHICAGQVNSWDKRCSRALGYQNIVCEGCIAHEYGESIDSLRSVMQNHFGLIPCPGI